MTTVAQIQGAIRDTLLEMDPRPSDNTPVVRQTTLSTKAAIGATSVQLTSLSGFTIASSLRFKDNSAEKTQYVAEEFVNANPVPLDFAKRDFSSLQYAHPAGTVVYTGLFDKFVPELGPTLGQGDPAITIRTQQISYKQEVMHPTNGNAPTFAMVLQYLRLLTPPNERDGVRVNRNAWAEEQQDRTHEDVGLINDALLANEQLLGLYTPACALKMAPINAAGDKTRVRIEPVPAEGDTWHYVATIVAVYVGHIGGLSA